MLFAPINDKKTNKSRGKQTANNKTEWLLKQENEGNNH